MKRSAEARWEGGIMDGKGNITVDSGTFQGAYSFNSRFGDDNKATNPEELIAAALAACYSMALTVGASQSGYTPKSVDTKAHVKIEKQGEGFVIPSIDLETEASIDGIDEAKFQTLAEETKKNCPVSKVLAGAEISLTAKLI
jgi:lipoyl-dependent peroxiredoxin